MDVYNGVEYWTWLDTTTGITTYQIIEKGKILEFNDLTAMKRHICYSKLQRQK